MDLLDNIHKTLGDDLKEELHRGSKVSIAAAFFSIYAYQALKNEAQSLFLWDEQT